MCALLVALGMFETWQEAATFMKSIRPRIRLNPGQMESLSKWTKFRETRARQSGSSPRTKPQAMRVDSLSSALDAYEL